MIPMSDQTRLIDIQLESKVGADGHSHPVALAWKSPYDPLFTTYPIDDPVMAAIALAQATRAMVSAYAQAMNVDPDHLLALTLDAADEA